MKKRIYLFAAISTVIFACNNEAKDSVEQADSINREKMDTARSAAESPIITDKESTDFLVDAANGGMAEVNLGKLAQEKGTHPQVKEFGGMMAKDHGAANDKIKALASRRNVTLPQTVSSEKQKDYDDLAKKTGSDFDKSYIKNMVKDHENDISKFEKASGKVNDPEVKSFIDNTLPTLKHHLDSVKAIQKRLK